MAIHPLKLRRTLILIGSTVLYSTSVQAAGFYLQESSVSSLGVGFADSVSGIDDASTIFFNPAGMTDLKGGAQAQFGVHVIDPHSKITDTGSTFDFNGGAPGGVGPVGGGESGNPYDPTPVPNAFIAMPLKDERTWFGLGVSAPFGLANKYDEDWFGRYDSTETKLTVINVSPVVGHKVNHWLSIGGGFDLQYAHASLESAVSNVVSEGTSQLKGTDYSLGYNFGAIVKPTETTRIGAHYRSAITHELEGSIDVRGLNAGNFHIPGTADLNLPDIATFGVTQEVNPDWRVMGQVSWYGWSNFDTITARNAAGTIVSSVPQEYRDTIAFSAGTEYDVSDDWTLRAGYQYDPTPTKDEFRTSRTPDGDRNWFTTGATYNVSDKTSLDFAAVYIDVGNETIDVTRNSGLNEFVADTEGSVGIISAAINYKF